MSESDWIIIQGIISLATTLIVFIIAALIIERKVESYNHKLAFYAIVFLVGLLIALIFPMGTNGSGRIELRTISLVGISLCALSVFASLTSYFIFYEKSIGKRMVNNARKYAAELGLNVNGIPNDKKYDFKKLYFTYSGYLDNRWGILLYDEHKRIASSNTDRSVYRDYYHYKVRLNNNKNTILRILKKNESVDYLPLNDEKLLITNDNEIDKVFTIFCGWGEEGFLNLVKKETFKNFLLKNQSLFEHGLKVNKEPEIVHLCVRSLHPNFGIFTDNFKIEFDYHLQKKKEHIQFLKEFVLFFDEA
jgi:hypothetical protein